MKVDFGNSAHTIMAADPRIVGYPGKSTSRFLMRQEAPGLLDADDSTQDNSTQTIQRKIINIAKL